MIMIRKSNRIRHKAVVIFSVLIMLLLSSCAEKTEKSQADTGETVTTADAGETGAITDTSRKSYPYHEISTTYSSRGVSVPATVVIPEGVSDSSRTRRLNGRERRPYHHRQCTCRPGDR